MKYDKLISIIVPCYNEELVVTESYKRIKNVLLKYKYNYELIFVNDGSNDNTLKILLDLSKKDSNVKIISFSKNFGHQPAVTAGIKNCNGDIALIIDADLQDPPEILPDMINKFFIENCNVVYGVREKRKGEGFFKLVTAKLFYRILNYFSDVKLPVDTGDFRLIDKKVIDCFKSLEENNKYIRGLISWMGFKQCPIYYKRDPRFSGKTKYSLKKMLRLAFTGIFYFSKKPLKISIGLGFFSIIVGLLLACYTIIAKFSSKIYVEQGWASTVIIIIFFGGIQLFTVGILGEYLGNIFDEVKKRPEYIIEEMINFEIKKEKKNKNNEK